MAVTPTDRFDSADRARADALIDEGLAHHRAGRWPDAERIYRQILETDARNANAWHLLGVLQYQAGNYAEAIDQIQRAIALLPSPVAVFLNNLGLACQAVGRLDEAADCYRRAIQAQRGDPAAYQHLARLLVARGEVREAADAWQALADMFAGRNESEEAYVYYRLACELRPSNAAAWHGRATALATLGRLDDAATAYRTALDCRADWPLAWNNLGWMYAQTGKLDEAERCFRRAIALAPTFPEAHMCLATALLRMGRYAEGWAEYEWRWKSQAEQFRRPARPEPDWDGQPLRGRTLLVEREQGLGDVLQFMRYIEVLQQRGEHVVFQCPEALRPLLSTCSSIQRLVGVDEQPPPCDVRAPLLSLPRLLGTTVQSVPDNVPYLTVPPHRVATWRARLAALDGLRIGIVWQGKPSYSADRQRSFPLQRFGPLAYLPGVHLISLQKDRGSEQLRDAPFPVYTLGERFDEDDGPFLDTAAVMMNLDLVIAPNTSVAHLAGSLNVPVWVALSAAGADWRWIIDQPDTPWYPRMRLYWQRSPTDWDEAFDRIYADVAALRRARA